MTPNTGDFLDWLRDDMAALRTDVDHIKTNVATLTVECRAAGEPHRKPCNTLETHIEDHAAVKKTLRGHAVGLIFRLIYAGIIGASAWAATYYAMTRAAAQAAMENM